MMQNLNSDDVQRHMPLGAVGKKGSQASIIFLAKDLDRASLPSTLSSLHHRWGNRRGRAGHGHPGGRVDDWDDLASPVGSRLVEVDMTGVGSDTGVDKGVGRGRRKGDRGGDLLHGLDLVLQRRGVGRPAGERGAVGRSRVDRVQLQDRMSIWL
jgi:hypothetical protein